MDTSRFSLIATCLFALAFAGMSWANKEFPGAMRAAPPQPGAAVAIIDDSARENVRNEREDVQPPQSEADKERDKLRIALLQASIGYKLLPCDESMKKNLVSALTNYTSAWAEMAACKSGACDGARLDAAAVAFRTPADIRVQQEMRQAIEKGGVTRDDFPQPIRNNVSLWASMPSGDPNACTVGRSADNTRR